MKVDRFVRAMLIIIAILLAVNCVTNPRLPAVDAQAQSKIMSWGLIGDMSTRSNVLVLYDTSTGDVWGYREDSLLAGQPVYIGKITQLGRPLSK